MLGAYLSSVIIWTAILYATAKIFSEQLVKNGWAKTREIQKIRNFVVLCAIPIVRLIAWVMILCMSVAPKNKQER